MSKVVKATNAAIINKVRSNASLEYQARIPQATDSSLHKTYATLQQYPVLWNEFCNVIILRIGLTTFNYYQFEIKLKPL